MKPVLRLRLHATQSQPCFPAASNALALPSGNGIFTATPTERITHYTLLRKVVCQGASPFGNPGQQNRRYAALSGSIPPFVVSSPFHGLRVVCLLYTSGWPLCFSNRKIACCAIELLSPFHSFPAGFPAENISDRIGME